MAKATLNKNGIASKAGDITVYNYDGKTLEYLSQTVEFLAVGVGIPAHACIDAPPESKPGFAICRSEESGRWEFIVDYRGAKLYSTKTGQAVEITEPGNYPDDVTSKAPSTLFDHWSGGEWVTDLTALNTARVVEAEQKKTALITSAKETISLWQTQLQLDIIGDDDKQNLMAWIKYIQLLQALDTNTAPDIDWPPLPK